MTDHLQDGIDEADDGIVEEDHPCIPDGIYTVTYLFHETVLFKGEMKVVVHLSIVDDEDWSGFIVCRYYNVRGHLGRLGRNGRFRAGKNSDLVREVRGLIEDQPRRLDRISLRRLKGHGIKARTRTVKGGWNRKQLPKSCWYSVVDELIELVDQEQSDWQAQHKAATGIAEGVTR